MRLDFDTAFPSVSGDLQRDLREVLNYLFMLREQMDYLTGHLETDNFSEAGLQELGEVITRPLTVSLKGTQDEVTQLKLWKDGLTLKVENGEASSVIRLMAGTAAISSQTIELKGLVSFTDLKNSGKTEINGDNITTGSLKAIDMWAVTKDGEECSGSMRLCYETYEQLAGGLRLDAMGAGTAGENQYRMFLYTNTVGGKAFAMKLESAESMSLAAANSVFIRGTQGVQITGPDIRLFGNVWINGQMIGAATQEVTEE